MIVLPVDEDLWLTPLEDVSTEALFGVVDSNRAYLRRWLPWVDDTTSSSDTADFQNLNRQLAAEGKARLFGVLVAGEVAGVLGFNTIDQTNRSGVIGYWLGEQFQGRGVMTRCLRSLVAHAFDKLDLNRIVIAAATENLRSQRLPQRLGFQQEGVSRQAEMLNGVFVDHAVFSLLREEYLLMNSDAGQLG